MPAPRHANRVAPPRVPHGSTHSRIPTEELHASHTFVLPYPLVGYDKDGDYYTNPVELLDGIWRLKIREVTDEQCLSVLLLQEGEEEKQVRYALSLVVPSDESVEFRRTEKEKELNDREALRAKSRQLKRAQRLQELQAQENALSSESKETTEVSDSKATKEEKDPATKVSEPSVSSVPPISTSQSKETHNPRKDDKDTTGLEPEHSDEKTPVPLPSLPVDTESIRPRSHTSRASARVVVHTPRPSDEHRWSDPEGIVSFSSVREGNNVWGCEEFISLSKLKSFIFYAPARPPIIPASSSSGLPSQQSNTHEQAPAPPLVSTIRIRLDLICYISLLQLQEKLNRGEGSLVNSISNAIDDEEFSTISDHLAREGTDETPRGPKSNHLEVMKQKMDHIVRVRGVVEEKKDEDLFALLDRSTRREQAQKDRDRERRLGTLNENSVFSTGSISSTLSSPSRRNKSPSKSRSSSKTRSPSKRRTRSRSPSKSPQKDKDEISLTGSFTYSMSSFSL